jgi:hypothetical protein
VLEEREQDRRVRVGANRDGGLADPLPDRWPFFRFDERKRRDDSGDDHERRAGLLCKLKSFCPGANNFPRTPAGSYYHLTISQGVVRPSLVASILT